jgi:hypothetical protein
VLHLTPYKRKTAMRLRPVVAGVSSGRRLR